MEQETGRAPTFVVLEDHVIVREGLERGLIDRFPRVDFAYSGAVLGEALKAIGERHIDCAIIDLDLGDGRSVADVVSSFSSLNIPVVVVSALGDPAVIQSAILAGASAYVTKRSGFDELSEALDAILHNRDWMSPDFAGALIPKNATGVHLSAQEQRALVLYASGLKMDSVARRMEVAPSTVKQYIDRVRDKYTAAGKLARTKTDLYRVARDEGLMT
ncbi:MAG: response regulator transcription factor [Actinobacteria bacterium]|nr:response regulator transcription factor [Actinomycetota bacterium]